MFDIEEVHFDPEPDFFGIPLFFKPLYFGLHPDFNDGGGFVLTLDFKAVLENEATGTISAEQMSTIASSLKIVKPKQALNYYN